MRRLILALAAGLAAGPAIAADEAGGFWLGGGVGAVSCPGFLDAMQTARIKGGVETLEGILEIDGFAQFVLGFQTAYNSQTPGVYDILAPLGLSPAMNALFAIEPWCASHPEAVFAQGVLDLAAKLSAASFSN